VLFLAGLLSLLPVRQVKSSTKVFARIWAILREFFWLGGAERKISHLSLADRIEIRNEVRKAVQTMREAEQTNDAEVRLHLSRLAFERMVVATAVALPITRAEDWPDLDQAVRIVAELPGLSQHDLSLALAPASGVEQSSLLARRKYALVTRLFAYLEEQIDTRTDRDFLLIRGLRVIGFLALLLCCGWVVTKPSNLARGKPVSMSSICSGTPPAPLAAPRLARVVDGIRREPSFAACTETENNPWIMVDLGEPHSVQEVLVYPQYGGYWGVDDLPVLLQVSADGNNFRPVGHQSIPTTYEFPWQLKMHESGVRYVRLAGGSKSPQHIYVSEIEVYGH
jgi:hypothetical protein